MTGLRTAARRDANERAIIQEFNGRGAVCYPVSAPGLPDLLVGFRGRWGLVEVKSKRGKLEPLQVLFHSACQAQGLPCAVVREIVDVEPLLAAWGA